MSEKIGKVSLGHTKGAWTDREGKSLSRVRLFASPWIAAYQALLPMGFSRQEYWSAVPGM